MATATENASLNIGFLGLGIMGVAMVRYCFPGPAQVHQCTNHMPGMISTLLG